MHNSCHREHSIWEIRDNLGQFIGENATSEQTATFVATHSSQILRGMIQAAHTLQIVRLTKTTEGFLAKTVDSAILTEAMKKPSVRAETVLDGIFSQAVTVIEGDGDRIVYQATWEVVGQERNFDIHFASVGGTGGIADTCALYRTLGIPVAVIADLDVVADAPRLKRIVESVCDDKNLVTSLHGDMHQIAELVRMLPPTVSAEDVRAKLGKLASMEFDWQRGDDQSLRESLSSVCGALNGMRRLKHGGLGMLPESVADPITKLCKGLARVGIFLVPVGELEEWLSRCGIEASKKKKWAWANEAANYVRTHDPRDDDIWGFVSELGEYLTAQFT